MNVDQMGVIENTSIDSINKSEKNSTSMESKISNDGASLCPITPYLNKENVKVTSPLKLNEDNDGLSTPMEDVFDSFAPGPEKLMLALNHTNHLEISGGSVARKLDFSSKEYVSEIEFENGALMETVYESILEAVICKQAEDILAEILAVDSSHDVLMTPVSVARLTGLAEACPGAPLKPKLVREPRNVNMSLCRKLDFDSLV